MSANCALSGSLYPSGRKYQLNISSLRVLSLNFHCNNRFLFVPLSSCLKIRWHILMNLFLNLERCYLEEAR